MAPPQSDDGHDLCLSCLGLEHSREGLSEDPCMNCSFMSRAVRAARLAEVEQLLGTTDVPPSDLPPPDQPSGPKHSAAETEGAPPRKRAKSRGLSSRIDQLTAELHQMKSLLLALQPATGVGKPGVPEPPLELLCPQDDALSVAASANQFNEFGDDRASQASKTASHLSAQSSMQGVVDNSMGAIICMALARLQLDVPQGDSAPASAFF